MNHLSLKSYVTIMLLPLAIMQLHIISEVNYMIWYPILLALLFLVCIPAIFISGKHIIDEDPNQ